ncbi:ABC transporter ATP-binding protein [Caproiciproducens sp. CPB-2]|uniref:ABC transporter ATP-binding protein n=1 Tax=unclassified Caproiciproducens TaxID=2643836 RepID=UPI0023DC7E93|nr:ABC transporter ATP-binding protein [Caproiciproducens sp. CPB-2]MDF1495641.1 ABC transporter ATP-binding protein [Caproiciproducens sp. CPB-2]
MDTILQVKGLTKEYHMGEVTVHALQGVDFTVGEGEFVVILGPSGSGKSTILNIVGGIDVPTAGQVLYRGQDISGYNQKKLTNYRRNAVGFVFQFYNLMQNLTALENITLASEMAAHPIDPRKLLAQIDMAERGGHFPSQLSGGQQQRVAIARAIAKNPDILLCDEPTGALDVSTGIQVLHLLKDFNESYRKTVVIITHNAGIAEVADRVLTVKDGRIAGDRSNSNPIAPEEVAW